MGQTVDYYTKYEEITGETIENRIKVMDVETVVKLMKAKVGGFGGRIFIISNGIADLFQSVQGFIKEGF